MRYNLVAKLQQLFVGNALYILPHYLRKIFQISNY